jgi:putative Mg2+ transporter-C (MgtC) family protein
MPEAEVRVFLAGHGFRVANRSNRMTRDGPHIEDRMTIRTTDPHHTAHLAASWRTLELVREFRISPMGD